MGRDNSGRVDRGHSRALATGAPGDLSAEVVPHLAPLSGRLWYTVAMMHGPRASLLPPVRPATVGGVPLDYGVPWRILVKSSAACLFLGATALPGLALAGDVTDPFEEPDESALFRAEERVVTVASRYAQAVEQAPSIVTVITDREIRSRGYRTLADVLRSLPGVFITVAPEGRQLAWFRGVISPDNNKFLLLVDGVPWYDGIYTHAWIDEYLPLVDVKQVEIIKGPGSAVHGTNAFAGVVNVVTYRAEDLQGGFARAEVGDDGRWGAAAVLADTVSVGGTDVEVRATARVLDMDGDGMDTTPRGRRDVTGMNPRRSILGRFGVAVAGLDLEVAAIDYRHTYLVNEQDDPIAVLMQQDEAFWLRYRDRFARARYEVPLGAVGILTAGAWWQNFDDPGQYAFLDDPSTTLDPDTGAPSTQLTGRLVETEKRSSRFGGNVESQLRAGPHNTTVLGVGIEATRVHALIDNDFVNFSEDPVRPSAFRIAEKDATIADAYGFVQHTWTASWWLELTGGARLDRHSYFGFFASPRAGILLLPTDGSVFKILYGRAFRAPNPRELLVVVRQDEEGQNLFTAGNAALSPEVIDTVETELTWSPWDPMNLRFAAFGSRVGQEINPESGNDPKLGTDYYENRGEATILGGEAQGTVDAGPFEIDVAYSATRAVDGTTSRAQYGVPVHMVNGRLGLEALPGMRVSLLVDHVGKRLRQQWTQQSGRPDGPAYTLMHLAAATDAMANGRVRADLSIRNLLDTRYENLVYLDDANRTTTNDAGQTVARFPKDLEAEGRTIVVGLEVLY